MNAPASLTVANPGAAAPVADATAFVAVLEALPVGVVALDAEARVLWANAKACELTGRRADSLLGLRRQALTDGLGTDAQGGRKVIWLGRTLDGGPAGWSEVGCLLEAENVRVAPLVAELSAVFGEGRTDAVTGLLSRKAMLAELAAQVSRSRRYGNPLGIIRLNVAFPAGEDIRASRRVVAQALKGCLRWVDYVGAWSETEFLLILPETRIAPARKLALKVTAEVSRQLAAAGRGVAPVIASVAEWQRGEDAAALLDRAAEPEQLAEPSETT